MGLAPLLKIVIRRFAHAVVGVHRPFLLLCGSCGGDYGLHPFVHRQVRSFQLLQIKLLSTSVDESLWGHTFAFLFKKYLEVERLAHRSLGLTF